MIKNIFIYICILISAYIFYLLFIGYLSFYILILTLLTPVISLLLILFNRKKSKISFLDNTIQCHQDESYLLKIKKDSALMGNCKISVFDTDFLLKNDINEFHHSFQHCGGINLSIPQYKQYDSLNMFYFRLNSSASINITIFPKKIDYNFNQLKSTLPGLDNYTYSTYQKGDDPTEIFDIHEYHEGDLLKNIHWKLSLKHNELLIKENALPLKQSLSIQCCFYDNDDDNDKVFQYLDVFCNYLLSLEIPFMLCNQNITYYEQYINALTLLLWNKKDIHNFIKSDYSYYIDKYGIHFIEV